MGHTDPTTVRLSDHFLLSDFMGCHSVYSKGIKNLWEDEGGWKLAEGRNLCERLLEPLLDVCGPMSISYGYISPALSKAIITYQDPSKPSYHRWDKGAAADVLVHAVVEDLPPVKLAHAIDEGSMCGGAGYSRMITYSESPYICLATQISEGDNFRRAFYENRYTGKKGAKPLYIKKAANAAGRKKQDDAIPFELDWKGAGYPTYHGGGIQQFQHRRVSRFSVMSDFLYSTKGICEGIANTPSLRSRVVFESAGVMYDQLLEALDIPRLSIVRAYESFRFNDYPLFSWKKNFAIDFIPPVYIKPSDVAEAAWSTGLAVSVSAENKTRRVRVVGKEV